MNIKRIGGYDPHKKIPHYFEQNRALNFWMNRKEDKKKTAAVPV